MTITFIFWYVVFITTYISIRCETFEAESKLFYIMVWIVFFPVFITADLAQCVNKFLTNN